MKPTISYLKDIKDFLFQERFELAKLRKSANWSAENLLKVLKSLKIRKSMDPVGFINELFKPTIAGSDVFNSLLITRNKVKDNCEIPEFVESSNISSIYDCTIYY